MLTDGGVESVKLPPRSPNLNAFAERCVRSVKQECLSKLILFGEESWRTAIQNFVAHYHGERNHQGLANKLICPEPGHVGIGGVYAPLRKRLRNYAWLRDAQRSGDARVHGLL